MGKCLAVPTVSWILQSYHLWSLVMEWGLEVRCWLSTRMFQLPREGSFNPRSIPKTPSPHDLPANTLSKQYSTFFYGRPWAYKLFGCVFINNTGMSHDKDFTSLSLYLSLHPLFFLSYSRPSVFFSSTLLSHGLSLPTLDWPHSCSAPTSCMLGLQEHIRTNRVRILPNEPHLKMLG